MRIRRTSRYENQEISDMILSADLPSSLPQTVMALTTTSRQMGRGYVFKCCNATLDRGAHVFSRSAHV